MKPTKENTLYLTIKQVYFDQIIEGSKKEEYREIKDTAYKKYLEVSEQGWPLFDTTLISEDDELLHLAVGYAKERDTAIVEITDITFQPLLDKKGNPARFSVDENDMAKIDAEGNLCFWMAVFHLGEIVELHRK